MEEQKQVVIDKHYWQKRMGDGWVESYWNTKDHPHRALLVHGVETLKINHQINTILEVGCGAGTNIALLKDYFPTVDYFGVDISEHAITKASKFLPDVTYRVADVLQLPFADKSMDVVISDACLMYIDDLNIAKALKEIDRIARHGIILIEWHDESLGGVVRESHWARNYQALLKSLGYQTIQLKITKDLWPEKNWMKFGVAIIARRP